MCVLKPCVSTFQFRQIDCYILCGSYGGRGRVGRVGIGALMYSKRCRHRRSAWLALCPHHLRGTCCRAPYHAGAATARTHAVTTTAVIKCHVDNEMTLPNWKAADYGSEDSDSWMVVIFPLVIKCFPCSTCPTSIQKYILPFWLCHINQIIFTQLTKKILRSWISSYSISLTSFPTACSPSWHSWVSAESTRQGWRSSLARNDAVIGISTNNTRIHHSHGNITQTSRVHACRLYSETTKFSLNHNLWLFLITLNAPRTLLFPGCQASLLRLTTMLARRAKHLYCYITS